MLRTTVSHIDMFRSFREDEDFPLEVFISQMRSPEPTEPMLRGRAFAKCLERAPELLETDTLSCDGYTFAFTGDFTIESFPRREESREKDYGGILVAARCDRALGPLIVDDKTTAHFDAEGYLDKTQWAFYLDMWGADVFKWFVWECKELKEPKAYEVFAMHSLTQYRYPDLEKDCRELALDFKKFAERWLPGYPYPRQDRCVSAPPPKPEWQMHATRGQNLIAVGHNGADMRCAFASKEGARFYVYQGVPEVEYMKILKNPFPDRLFTSHVKGKYPVQAA